jgi:tetratricopeptide (TPR) repeat protein
MPPSNPHKRQPSRPPAGSGPEAILALALASREVIQDFVPLAASIEWRLGQEYLRLRGSKAFLSDAHPVPYVINNDGTLSHHAAHVLFASLQAADQARSLPPDLFVLELGIGVGLFARYFLDAFRDLCHQHQKDYYDRLTYIAADRSQRMLHDLGRHGVLADHAGHYRLRLVDALDPAPLLRDLAFVGQARQPLQAVFLNYLLDCLPAAPLEFQGEQARQLCVRTCLARNVRLEQHTELPVAQLAQRAEQGGAQADRDLLEVYGLFSAQYDYLPVDLARLPYGAFAAEQSRRSTGRLLHSWGAIQCLERVLQMVSEGGFILINDYGPTQLSREDEFEHQRFSLATFVGVNFPLLRDYFGQGEGCDWMEPFGGEERGIHTRLLGRKVPSAVGLRFEECFGRAAQQRLHEPLQRARALAQAGRRELAGDEYLRGVREQPHNWVLLNEASSFLIFWLGEVKAGVELAKAALRLNPGCSAELWNTLGDGLFEWGRLGEARSAYGQALRVNESDVRARWNLAWVQEREGEEQAALEMLAEALALDRTGEYRDKAMQKQAEVLSRLHRRQWREDLLLANLVSKYPAPKPPAASEAR